MQKKILYYMGKKYKHSDVRHVSESLSTFNIHSLEKRRKMLNFLYIFKILRNYENNEEFLKRLCFNVSGSNTRSLHLFYQPAFRTNIERNSPVNRMCELINKYPEIDVFYLSLSKVKQKCLNSF